MRETYLCMGFILVGFFLVLLDTLPALQTLVVDLEALRLVHPELEELDVLAAHGTLLELGTRFH